MGTTAVTPGNPEKAGEVTRAISHLDGSVGRLSEVAGRLPLAVKTALRPAEPIAEAGSGRESVYELSDQIYGLSDRILVCVESLHDSINRIEL